MILKNTNVTPIFSKYQIDGSLALILEDEMHAPYGVVTVCIVDSNLSNERCQYIDTNNFGDDIIEWLDKNDFGKLTGNIGISGFYEYPEFEFKQEIIDKFAKN